MSFFKTLDDVDVRDKTVIVRVDLNSPVDPETKKIQDNERLRAHAETLRELSDSCLLYTSPSPRDRTRSRMPSSA